MKAMKLIQYFGMALMLFLVSCSDDFFQYDEVREGLPASLKIKYVSTDNSVVSRTGRDEAEEKKLSNIYLFIFDHGGNKVFGNSYIVSNTEGTIQVEDITSMNGAYIVGIANVGITDYGLSNEVLGNVSSKQDLKELMVKMTSSTIERYNNFLMVGELDGVNIYDNSGSPTQVELQLRRIDAKVKFDVKIEPKNQSWTNFSFRPKTWIVKQVPNMSYLIEHESGDYDAEDATYFQTKELTFEETTREGNVYTGGNFTFYMPENKKTCLHSVKDYAQREAWDKEDENGNKVFTNAHPNSTYVEITGLLSYTDENEREINADVRFIVHLGYASGKPDDYDTKRNTFYTYTVKVKGVHSIEVEVSEKPMEIRPGYEGDVVYTEKQSFTFDSHYDRRLIKMDPKYITEEVGISWSVNTPFSRGVHKIGSGDVPKELKDYRWIKFAINKDYGVPENQYVKYPGDKNYDDPYVNDGSDNQPSPYYTSVNPSFGAPDGKDHSNARLLDINQLCERLIDEPDGEISITAFVDEYLYYKHPIEDTGEGGLSLWKLTTDKQDRTLHLVVKDAQSSPDGNSSMVTAEFSFKQRTIQTVYNADDDGPKTAWGLESVMETKRMSPKGISQNANSTSNGRLNTLKSILGDNYKTNKSVKWTDILGVDDSYTLKGDQNAVRACLLRNRDLNGDNIVDANEIQWYLASIDQLTDIYLGEYALDEQSRLYPKNPADRENQVRWHYASSSFSRFEDVLWPGKDKSYVWKLWSEEGASRGEVDMASTGDVYAYRCVRNLGLPLDEVDAKLDDIVQVESHAEGYLIDLTNMNSRSRRSSAVIGNNLGAHNEREDRNRPYIRFVVHKDVFPTPQNTGSWSNKHWNYHNWDYYQTHNPSPEGYRIPNQRELLIMTTRMPDNAWRTFDSNGESITPHYVSYTAFSLKGKEGFDNNREGFLWDSENKVFYLQNNRDEKGYIRPVKDIE